MKKSIYYYLGILFFFQACDRDIEYDYIIRNNCQNNIVVKFINYRDSNFIKTIDSNSESLIHVSNIVGSRVYTDRIHNEFKDFDIQIDSTLSKFNYINVELWIYNEISKTHAEYTLVVDSTHFE
ncbi:MAG: hypothetical protein HY738_20045 [Bacteroidia bacterium]|nr:hypothetical protein [Bacteroidia bacterium]